VPWGRHPPSACAAIGRVALGLDRAGGSRVRRFASLADINPWRNSSISRELPLGLSVLGCTRLMVIGRNGLWARRDEGRMCAIPASDMVACVLFHSDLGGVTLASDCIFTISVGRAHSPYAVCLEVREGSLMIGANGFAERTTVAFL